MSSSINSYAGPISQTLLSSMRKADKSDDGKIDIRDLNRIENNNGPFPEELNGAVLSIKKSFNTDNLYVITKILTYLDKLDSINPDGYISLDELSKFTSAFKIDPNTSKSFIDYLSGEIEKTNNSLDSVINFFNKPYEEVSAKVTNLVDDKLSKLAYSPLFSAEKRINISDLENNNYPSNPEQIKIAKELKKAFQNLDSYTMAKVLQYFDNLDSKEMEGSVSLKQIKDFGENFQAHKDEFIEYINNIKNDLASGIKDVDDIILVTKPIADNVMDAFKKSLATQQNNIFYSANKDPK